jgi:hypothetical protein
MRLPYARRRAAGSSGASDVCGHTRKHAIGCLNGRGGRVYLSEAGLSRFIQRSNCGWYSADLVCERSALPRTISSGAVKLPVEVGEGLRRTRFNLKRSWQTISAATIDRLRSAVRAESWPKGVEPSLVDRKTRSRWKPISGRSIGQDSWPTPMRNVGTVNKLSHARLRSCREQGMTDYGMQL